jgi:hypothetical protein
LRTLFVVVTIFGCWLGHEWNWIRQRHEARQWVESHEVRQFFGNKIQEVQPGTKLPWTLRILDEKPLAGGFGGGRTTIEQKPGDDPGSYKVRLEEVCRLFPEASFVTPFDSENR